MKTALFFVIFLLAFSVLSFGQYKKDGTPDMRYKSNKQSYGNTNQSNYNSNTNSSVRYQQGYTKTDGTYVEPHHKTNNNKTNRDNYSTKDNVNTYTSKSGSRAKDYSNDALNYGNGKTVHTGNRGGQYYYNDKGKKVYVPKR